MLAVANANVLYLFSIATASARYHLPIGEHDTRHIENFLSPIIGLALMNFATLLTVSAFNFIVCHPDDADRDLADWTEPNINDEIKENIGSTTCQKYPIIIPANLVIEICLRDTMLPNKLEGNDECGDDYKCVFAKIIAHESMKSLVLLLKNEATGKVDQEFKRAAHDCVIWWKLIRTMNANLNGPNELAKCLFQSFALKCKKTVLDKVKEHLMSKMKNLTYQH